MSVREIILSPGSEYRVYTNDGVTLADIKHPYTKVALVQDSTLTADSSGAALFDVDNGRYIVEDITFGKRKTFKFFDGSKYAPEEIGGGVDTALTQRVAALETNVATPVDISGKADQTDLDALLTQNTAQQSAITDLENLSATKVELAALAATNEKDVKAAARVTTPSAGIEYTRQDNTTFFIADAPVAPGYDDTALAARATALEASQTAQDTTIAANAAHVTDTAVHVPAGGTINQVLSKASATDGDAAWADQSGAPNADAVDLEIGDADYDVPRTFTAKQIFDQYEKRRLQHENFTPVADGGTAEVGTGVSAAPGSTISAPTLRPNGDPLEVGDYFQILIRDNGTVAVTGVAETGAFAGIKASSHGWEWDGTGWNDLDPAISQVLTQAEAEDETSTEEGTLTGQRLFQAIQKHAPVVTLDDVQFMNGAPGAGDGLDGQVFIDISQPLWPVYGPKAGGVWPATSGSVFDAPATELTQPQAESTTGADYTAFGDVSAERLDQWANTRTVMRVFNASGTFDFNALNYPDRTAVFIRNIDPINGLGITYGTGGAVARSLVRSDGRNDDAAAEDSFNLQPSEMVFMETNGGTLYGSVIPGERIVAKASYADASADGPYPHDAIIAVRATQELWVRATGVNNVQFPADGIPTSDWFKLGGTANSVQVFDSLGDVDSESFADGEIIMIRSDGRGSIPYIFEANGAEGDYQIADVSTGYLNKLREQTQTTVLDADGGDDNVASFSQQDVNFGDGINDLDPTAKLYYVKRDAASTATQSFESGVTTVIPADDFDWYLFRRINETTVEFMGKPFAAPGDDTWVLVADGGNFEVSKVSYQLLTTDTGVEPTLNAGQWFSFVRPDADGKNIATYKFHDGTAVQTIETGTNELAVVRYTADGAIQDFDHKAIFETGAANMTLSASTVGRVIQMVSEGPTTVVTADGTEQFTGSQGTSTDSKLTINQAFKWATVIGRTAGGWSQYVGQAGIPDGVDISTPTTFKAAARLVQNGVENSASVTFPTPFKSGTIPSVLPVPFAPGDNQSVTLQSVDHLGFTVWVVRNESDVGIASPTIHWSATGEPA